MADVVVVGGGVGGLCAAVGAAARGHAVALVEAGPGLGGKAGRVRVDGVALDTGPSVLTLPEVFDEALALAGEPPLRTLRPARWARYRWPDGAALELGNGLAGTLEGVRASFGAGPAAELERFLLAARRAWEVAAPRFVFGPAPRLAALASARPHELLAIRPFTRLWDWIAAEVREPHLQALLARFATYAGSDARRAPAVLGTIAWVELGLGGFGVEGGIAALVDRLAGAARRLGVRLRTSARVEEILVARGRARGVVLEGGERLEADAVVANAEAGEVLGRLLPAHLRARAGGEPSFSGRCLILRAPRAERPAHEVLMPADYLAELEDLRRGREVRDPALTVCAPRVAHAVAGWGEEEALFAMVNAPPLPAGGRGAGAEPVAEGPLLARLQRAGVAGPGARVVWSRGVRRLAADFPGSGGALYGAASHSWLAAFQRPPNRVARVPGLFLAGGSAHPGAGLPLVASSGLRAAEALEEDLGRRQRGRAPAAAAALALLLAALPAGAQARAAPLPDEAAALDLAALLQRAEVDPDAAPTALALAESDRTPAGRVLEAEAAWRVAEASPEAQRRARFADAVARARAAVAAAPSSGGAWFWLGVALTSDARERGLLALIGAASEIRAALHRAAALDPSYQGAAPLSALCSLYHHAPGPPLSFGDAQTSRGFCEAALRRAPASWEAHLVLARAARSAGDEAGRRRHLAAILDGPLDARQPATHRRYRDEARQERSR